MGMLVGVSVGGVMMVVLWRWIFGEWDEFTECVRYAIRPNWWSFLEGELEQDYVASFRLGAWMGGSFAAGAAAWWTLTQLGW